MDNVESKTGESSINHRFEDLPIETKACLLLPVEFLSLSTRPSNALAKIDVMYIGDLVRFSEAELLRLRGLGRTSLEEISQHLRNLDLHLGMRVLGWKREEVTRWRDQLAPEIEQIAAAKAVQVLQFQGRKPVTVEEELAALAVAMTKSPRRASIVIERFGWSGSDPRTLEEVGQAHGITRERVRQIEAAFRQRLKGRPMRLPLLERAIDLMLTKSPGSARRIEEALLQAGLTRRHFSISGLIEAAQLVERPAGLRVEKIQNKPMVGSDAELRAARLALHRARAAVSRWGCTNVEEVAALVSEEAHMALPMDTVREVLSARADTSWLDKERMWFWFSENSRNRATNVIRKVLSVAPQLRIGELRSALRRVRRLEGSVPPRAVLLELCRQHEFCRVEGEIVRADRPLDPSKTLRRMELILYRVLVEQGPLMGLRELEGECLRRGMNQHTFVIYLSSSPIVARLAPAVYSLVGAHIPPGLAEAIKGVRPAQRVLLDSGWESGDPWIIYRISRPVLRGGALGVPHAFGALITGGYDLTTSEGQKIGTINIVDGRINGLSMYLRRRGGEEGDIVKLQFDIGKRNVKVEFIDALQGI